MNEISVLWCCRVLSFLSYRRSTHWLCGDRIGLPYWGTPLVRYSLQSISWSTVVLTKDFSYCRESNPTLMLKVLDSETVANILKLPTLTFKTCELLFFSMKSVWRNSPRTFKFTDVLNFIVYIIWRHLGEQKIDIMRLNYHYNQSVEFFY